MTSTMQEAISHAYQAGIEIGRAAAKQEMEQIAKITAAYAEHAANAPVSVYTNRGVVKVTPGRPTKAPKVDIVVNPKAIARGVKKAAGPRTPGVKAAILALLASGTNAMTPAAIISATGFKGTSVRATLMGLKKAGLARNGGDGSWWLLTHGIQPHGNSEEVEAHEQL